MCERDRETDREADRQTGTDRERLGHTQRQTDGPSEADLTTTKTVVQKDCSLRFIQTCLTEPSS